MEKSITILCNTSSYNYTEFPSSLTPVKNESRKKLTEDELIRLIEKHDPVGTMFDI